VPLLGYRRTAPLPYLHEMGHRDDGGTAAARSELRSGGHQDAPSQHSQLPTYAAMVGRSGYTRPLSCLIGLDLILILLEKKEYAYHSTC
jgi:hypothetical protein